jgi:hypothetical protein
MKTSPRVSLLSMMTRWFTTLGVVSLVVLALDSAVFAATPVDIFQDMESGNAGDVLTPTIMNASSHGGGSSWSVSSGTLWVATNYARNLPGPVIIGSTTYNGTGGTRTWACNDNYANNYVTGSLAGNYSKMTVACYYTPTTTVPAYNSFDHIVVLGDGIFMCMSLVYASQYGGQYIEVESCHANYGGSTDSPPIQNIVSGKTYWINMHYDSSASACYLAAYDPDNSFTQVGSTVSTVAGQSTLGGGIRIGRSDNHGNNTLATTKTYIDNLIVDYTNAAFPLIPSGGTDTTPPSVPGAVRDGTGTDIAYTSSNTQLSANWDASSDAESGISGYQYAIGTTAGGTQTVNWTSLGNVTTYTKTSLSLTNGQTYYFSVKAVNGAGLTGNAKNSNGQEVDTTAPSAPATVRDGTGTDISTTSSTTQLSANWDASADSESGISGYQYAIGTTAGGTQTVNWTSLGNVTTYTKTSLALSVGQTYYFSVKAVNGVGLTGAATNSNGQTVVSGGGSVTYFSDNFESWTVHGGAWSSVSGETATHTLNTSTDYAKAGTKGLKLTDTDTTSSSGACLVKNFSPAISGDIYTRFYVFFPTGYGSTNSGCTRRVLRVWCGGNRAQMSFKDGVPNMEEVGAWGAAKGSAVSEGAWHCIEMHGATPSASTLMEFWVDGVKNSATLNGAFSGSTTWDYMELGDVVLGGGSNGTGAFYIDEVVVSNSYVGTATSVTYFSDTFENWTVHGGAWSSVSGESSMHTLNTSTDQARSGTKSLKLTDTDTSSVYGACLVKNFSPTISGDIYVRFYVFLPTGYGSTNQTGARRILRVWCGGNDVQMSTKNGTIPAMEEVGSWGQAAGSALSENAWHCIEVHGAAPSASTLLEFWVDGVKNSGTLNGSFSGSTVWTYMEFGDVCAGGGTNGTGAYYMDEVVVSNSYVGTLP